MFKEPRQQFLITYEPDIEDSTRERASDADLANAAGYLPVNEMLLQFPALKEKYRDSYDYYVKKNKFEEDVDYTI